ncbi:Uncharacterised protein [Chlamydia abortus]|nr:Uncharacterised protein [Chlamydia abortus]
MLISLTGFCFSILLSNASIEHLAPFFVLNFEKASLQDLTIGFSENIELFKYFSASRFAFFNIALVFPLPKSFIMLFIITIPNLAFGKIFQKLLSIINFFIIITSNYLIYFHILLLIHQLHLKYLLLLTLCFLKCVL